MNHTDKKDCLNRIDNKRNHVDKRERIDSTDRKDRTENRTKANDAFAVLKRLFAYMLAHYRMQFFLVVAFIVIGAICTMRGMLFSQSLVDDYILPILKSDSPEFYPLAQALAKIAVIYVVGVFSAYAYNRIMVNISQGTMLKLRTELFSNMESLPIRYFDTHAHGDIMSVYTNDVDTLRQLFGQSIPQVINSAVTIVATLISMLILNIPLAFLSVLMSILMLVVTKKISGLSGKYFYAQQKDLGTVDGFIEEMMDGQKVIKVFCHEETSIEDFKKINNQLRESADKANRYANILMPINGNIGNLSYVLCAVCGAPDGTKGNRRNRDDRNDHRLCRSQQEFHSADHSDQPTAQLDHHGICRC